MSAFTIEVRLSRADQSARPYYYVPIDVPEGTTRLDVTMSYPKSDDAVIDLGLFDPRAGEFPTEQGFRGWSGGARDSFFVACDDATPGYVPGEMPAGEWRIALGLYKVPEAGVLVTLNIKTDAARRPLFAWPGDRKPVRPGAGWYKGDLHCHTHHSDARGAPELLHAAATQAGLDFLAVADHNTITQRRYFHEHSSPALVFVRAMEITVAEGHANVFGVDDWADFRMTRPEDAHTLAKIVHEKGGLLSINHDKPPIPWTLQLPDVDCMEVWQSHWLAWNWIALQRYDERLRAGRRISLIGGSDFHQPARLLPEGPLTLARPTTVLWLPELSEDAVLAAMRAGHGYVTEAPDGPHLSFTANGQSMGSVLENTDRVDIAASVTGAAGDRLRWTDATGVIAETEIASEAWSFEFDAHEFQQFLRAEIIAESSWPRLVTTLRDELEDRPLPWGLDDTHLQTQPLRRALSNPVYR